MSCTQACYTSPKKVSIILHTCQLVLLFSLSLSDRLPSWILKMTGTKTSSQWIFHVRKHKSQLESWDEIISNATVQNVEMDSRVLWYIKIEEGVELKVSWCAYSHVLAKKNYFTCQIDTDIQVIVAAVSCSMSNCLIETRQDVSFLKMSLKCCISTCPPFP